MPRWRLNGKHYVRIEGTEWEFRQTSQLTGKQHKQVLSVPRYLDPEDPNDCNYPGEIIVAIAPGALPNDLILLDEPSFEMEPIDEAAMKITAKMRAGRPGWDRDPFDELPTTMDESSAPAATTRRA
jgi:hypothetical protein